MILRDKNQSWKPPDGFDFEYARPGGSYICLVFSKKTQRDTTKIVEYVVVYINDQGREVIRTETQQMVPNPPVTVIAPVKLKGWQKILAWAMEEDLI